MVDRKKLITITYLKFDGELLTNDSKLSDYSQLLVKFTETIPDQEEALKQAMEIRDHALYIQSLAAIWDMLEKIHADDLSEWCLKQIYEFKKMANKNNVDYEAVITEMTNFLTILSTLSIDIQVALYQWAPAPAPQARPVMPIAKPPEEKPVPKKKNAADKIILAVDDAPFFLTTLKNCLQRLPYKLFCVTSGAAALRFLREHEPDLFVLDIEMPEMNGHELAKRIKENGHQSPIIFLTGNATEKNVRKALEAGVTDFIVKPISDELVVTKIRKYLEG